MNSFARSFTRENILLAGFTGLGPLLLLSDRLIYALTLSTVLLIYAVLMFGLHQLAMRFLHEEIRIPARLLFAATLIAIIDMLMTTYLPAIRADFGILLPLILSSGYLVYRESGLTSEELLKAPVFFGSLLGYIAVFLVIAILREFVNYGSLHLSVRPWDSAGAALSSQFSLHSTFGLLLILTYARVLFRRLSK